MVATGETWVPALLCPVGYEVSCQGRVRNAQTKKIKKPQITNQGYCRLGLWHKGSSSRHYIHRLIYFSFTPSADPSLVVHHINGDKQDNRLENLIAVTATVNTRLWQEEKLYNATYGKISIAKIRRIRNAAAEGKTYAQIAKDEGISKTYARQIAIGKSWGWIK